MGVVGVVKRFVHLLMQKNYVSVGTTEQLIDVTASILQTLMVACYMVLLYRALKAVVKERVLVWSSSFGI